jgi:sugar porter (SP) family MFS transporter
MVYNYPILLWVATAAALVGSFQFGFQIAVLNPTLDAIVKSLGVTSRFLSACLVSSILVGALFGSLYSGSLADIKGPKMAILLTTPLFFIGSCLSASAKSSLVFFIARFVTGISVGSTSLLVPRYLTEISPLGIRGFISSLNQIFICIGILTSFLLGLLYENDPDAVSFGSIDLWRLILALGAAFSILQAAIISVCPETPIWLLWNGLHLQATSSYRMLHGRAPDELEGSPESSDELTEHAESAILEPQYSNRHSSRAITENGQNPFSFRNIFEKKYRNIARLALTIPVAQQLSGINVMILYGSSVFRMIDPSSSPMQSNMLLGMVNAIFAIVSALIVDSLGRRTCLISSFFGMSACLFSITCALTIASIPPSVAMWSLIAYMCAFGIGCGGIPWVYVAEILPDEVKNFQSIGTCLNWIANILVSLSFSISIVYLFPFYALCCAASGYFCYIYMIETKQKSLHSVHKELMILSNNVTVVSAERV